MTKVMRTKIIFTFIFLMGLIVSASAKKKPGKTTDVYLKAGVNLSNAHGVKPNVPDKDFKTGFNVGLQADTRLDGHLYFQSGIFFTKKGVEYNSKGKDESTKINQMYLQLPLALAYKFHLDRKTHLVLNFGPYVTYGIAGKVDDGGAKKHDTFDKAGLKRFDAGLLGGIGFEFDRILLGVNYEHGLLDIAQAKKESYKNQNISISLGYKF
ncbi:MAG TPA: hypothetical protein DIT04_04235 [Dysgonomonas sp.]|nr:hypothetical protein [Dysgonomonas sp.]